MYEVRVDPRQRFVHIRFARCLKAADALDALRDIEAHPGFRAGLNGLVDLREVTELEVRGDDVRQIAQAVAAREELYRGSRWAVVADSASAFGVARQFQALRDELDYQLEVFRAMDDACAWLGLSPSVG